MARPSREVLLLIALLPLFAASVAAMKEGFRIKLSHEAKCYSIEVHQGALVVGSYRMVPQPHQHDFVKLASRIASPMGDEMHEDEDVSEGSFGFSAPEEGEYHMCLWATHLHHGEPPVLVDVMLRSTPKEIDYSSVARHEHVESLEGELGSMDDLMVSTLSEMEQFSSGIDQLHKTRKRVINLIGWMGAVTIVVSTGLTALQFWYLKTFFQRKKVL